MSFTKRMQEAAMLKLDDELEYMGKRYKADGGIFDVINIDETVYVAEAYDHELDLYYEVVGFMVYIDAQFSFEKTGEASWWFVGIDKDEYAGKYSPVLFDEYHSNGKFTDGYGNKLTIIKEKEL